MVPYDETTDTYRGLDLYKTEYSDPSLNQGSISKKIGESVGLTISAIHEARRNGKLSSATRITRDPTFNLRMEEEEEFSYSENGLDDDAFSRPGSAWESSRDKSAHVLTRPNLLDKTVMTRLRQLLLLGMTSGAFPWTWNKKTTRIDKWPRWAERLWIYFWIFSTIQTTFLTGFQFYSFYSRVKGETKTYREVFMNSLSVYWYVCAIYFNINMYLYKDQIRQYINTMLAMNAEFCGKCAWLVRFLL
jgi:hypothetical protein